MQAALNWPGAPRAAVFDARAAEWKARQRASHRSATSGEVHPGEAVDVGEGADAGLADAESPDLLRGHSDEPPAVL